VTEKQNLILFGK